MGNTIFGKHPLTIYRVVTPDQHVLPLGDAMPVHDALHVAPFVSISATTDAKGFGFVTLENHRSVAFGPGTVDFGPYHVFSVRIDERKVPPAALKEAMAERMEDELTLARADGKALLSKDRKREIRDQVRLRMMARAPVVPKVVDAVWNHETGLLYICDKSSAVLDAFEFCFARCFGPGLELMPFSPSDIMPGLDMLANTGGAFLTWLYGRRDESRAYAFGEIVMEAGIEDRIEISRDGEVTKSTAKSDDFPEIDAGLEAGKSVSRANVVLEQGAQRFTLDVSGVIFPVNSLEGPKVERVRDYAELAGAVIEAAGNIETGVRLLCALLGCWAAASEGQRAFIATPEIMKAVDKLRGTILGFGKGGSKVTVSFGGKEIVLEDDTRKKAAA